MNKERRKEILKNKKGSLKISTEDRDEILLEIYRSMAKMERFMLTSRLMSLAKTFIIVVPFVLAIIYLPPVVQNLIDKYQSVIYHLYSPPVTNSSDNNNCPK